MRNTESHLHRERQVWCVSTYCINLLYQLIVSTYCINLSYQLVISTYRSATTSTVHFSPWSRLAILVVIVMVLITIITAIIVSRLPQQSRFPGSRNDRGPVLWKAGGRLVCRVSAVPAPLRQSAFPGEVGQEGQIRAVLRLRGG